ncbi:MAG TPA: metallophosphoesterase, partial [Verrucomicrobiae bacterium]|nr:metallophosphoesterase [Verrucomicrobiae bacterium]
MSNPTAVYNLFWFHKQIDKDHPARVSRHERNTLTPGNRIQAIILYPALATPEILVGDLKKVQADEKNVLEVLLLTQGALPQIKRRILDQLKFTVGLTATKPAFHGNLPVKYLKVETIPFSLTEKLHTLSGKFKGYIDKRPYEMYQDAGFNTLYSIALDPACLESGLTGGHGQMASEPQDRLMAKKVFDKRHPQLKDAKDGRYYSFDCGGDDVDCTVPDKREPLQSYHPVYHFNKLNYANVGHYSDLHLSSRQQILAQTKARVIDYVEPGFTRETGPSPEIGTMINICSADVIDVLGQFQSSAVHLLVIGGDVVDFLQNCHLSHDLAPKIKDRKPKKIWDAVTLEGSFAHTDYIDFVAFFGILMDFCAAKPVFLLSGNHDCYWEPYGISPRLAARQPGDKWYQGSGTGLKRANEGIPADHNLTFYEAILAFGNSYMKVLTPAAKSPVSPFRDDHFDWFYTVFTPFTDYLTELPHQFLLAFSWGNDEDLIDIPKRGHGWGHLPRANEDITDNQDKLLTDAVGKGKKVILTTHFTFVSYAEKISMDDGGTNAGDVYFSFFKGYDDWNFGTFEKRRAEMFETHCYNNRDIQVILTGHSHRRGLYLIDNIDYSGRNSVKTLYFDFEDWPHLKKRHQHLDKGKKLEPAVIVSDSGATIPRFNKSGEFSGWGSDQPSGTKIVFDQKTGSIHDLEALRASTCNPRVVVAIDYVDVYLEKSVITKFESEEFDIQKERDGTLPLITFYLGLNEDITRYGLDVEWVCLYSMGKTGVWNKIQLYRWETLSTPGNSVLTMDGPQAPIFRDVVSQNQERGNFMAIKFQKVASDLSAGLDRYDFTDPWCFEFQVDFGTYGRGVFHWSPKTKKYFIQRDKTRAEIPSFDW